VDDDVRPNDARPSGTGLEGREDRHRSTGVCDDDLLPVSDSPQQLREQRLRVVRVVLSKSDLISWSGLTSQTDQV
jgi:hypothetical protein